jgi:hypothetical protein
VEIVAQLPLHRGLEGKSPALDPVLPPQSVLLRPLLPENMLRTLGALHPLAALRLPCLADRRGATLRPERLRLAPLEPNRCNAALGARLTALDPDRRASLLRPRLSALDARRGAAILDIALRPAVLDRRRAPRLALGAALLLALGPLLLRRLPARLVAIAAALRLGRRRGRFAAATAAMASVAAFFGECGGRDGQCGAAGEKDQCAHVQAPFAWARRGQSQAAITGVRDRRALMKTEVGRRREAGVNARFGEMNGAGFPGRTPSGAG